MSNSDKFEIRRTIKRLEGENSAGIIIYFGILAVGTWLSWARYTEAETAILLLVAYLGGVILYQVRLARLDILRASLRQIVLAQDPTVLTDDEW